MNNWYRGAKGQSGLLSCVVFFLLHSGWWVRWIWTPAVSTLSISSSPCLLPQLEVFPRSLPSINQYFWGTWPETPIRRVGGWTDASQQLSRRDRDREFCTSLLWAEAYILLIQFCGILLPGFLPHHWLSRLVHLIMQHLFDHLCSFPQNKSLFCCLNRISND